MHRGVTRCSVCHSLWEHYFKNEVRCYCCGRTKKYTAQTREQEEQEDEQQMRCLNVRPSLNPKMGEEFYER